MRSLLIGVLLGMTMPAAAVFGADEPAENGRGDSLDRLRRFYLAEASAYSFFLDEAKTQPLKVEPQPVQSWTGTEGWSGDVFVWTREGRPEVIGGIGSWPNGEEARFVFHEFQSLALAPLPAVPVGDGGTWSSENAGIELKPLETDAPAANRPRRLNQMRQLAREFEPHLLGPAGDEALRLLPQPIYRYHDTKGDLVDGAIFAYVFSTTGTDIDFLLVLECRRSESGLHWHAAPARFTWRGLWLKHDGREIWRVEPHHAAAGAAHLRTPYISKTVKSVREADLPPEARP